MMIVSSLRLGLYAEPSVLLDYLKVYIHGYYPNDVEDMFYLCISPKKTVCMHVILLQHPDALRKQTLAITAAHRPGQARTPLPTLPVSNTSTRPEPTASWSIQSNDSPLNWRHLRVWPGRIPANSRRERLAT